MSNVISYERFCAARKAKLENIEVELDMIELDWTDEKAAIDAARDFYAEQHHNRFDYE